MDRFAGQSVHHLDSEGRKATPIIGLGCEKTGGRLYESVETFLGREIRLVAGHRRPEKCRAVDGVVPGHTSHSSQLATDIVLDAPQFLSVVAPCHDIEVGPD